MAFQRRSRPNLATSSAFNAYGVSSIYGADALRAYETLYTRRGNVNADISNKNWEVNEQVTTAYFQANVNTDIGSIPVKGNVGIQAVSVDQKSQGFRTYPGNGVGAAISDGAAYTDFLPSLNLSFGLPWDQFVRVAAGRQVARPRTWMTSALTPASAMTATTGGRITRSYRLGPKVAAIPS